MYTRDSRIHTARPPTLLGILLFLAILATTGCDAVLTTAQFPPVREDGILGEWKDLGTPGSEPQADHVLFRFIDGEYRAGSPDDFAKGNAGRFTLARAGNVLLVQSPADTQCDEFGVQKGQPCWSLSRIELSGDRLNFYDFDAPRLGRESFGSAMNVAHSVHRERKKDGGYDTAVLLSAGSSELVQFLESYVKRRAVFRLTGRLQRIPTRLAQ
jgi:hypothetical protein